MFFVAGYGAVFYRTCWTFILRFSLQAYFTIHQQSNIILSHKTLTFIQIIEHIPTTIYQPMNYQVKKVCSLISGCMVHTVYGSVYTLGTVTPYIATYLKYGGDTNIKVVDISILYPLIMIFENIGIIFAMLVLEKYLSMKLICLMGTTGVALSVLASAYIESYAGYCVVYGACFGFFVGIGYMMPLKNTYTYFPNRKGMCAGICMMGYGVGSLAYNEIFLKLVNPDNLVPDSEHFFPKEVADNFPKALLFLSLIYFIIGVIAFLLFYPKPTSLSTSILTEDSNISQPLQQTPKASPTPSELYTFITTTPHKKNQMLKMITLMTTSLTFGVFVGYNYKQYGETVVNSDNLITLTGSIGSITNSAGRIVWGFVFDYLAFKPLMMLLNGCLLLCCVGFIFNQNQNLFVVLVLCTFGTFGSYFNIMPTQTVRVMGERYGSSLYPWMFIGLTLAAILQFVLHETLIREMGNEGFVVVFGCFAGVQTIALVLSFVFRFRYAAD